MSWRCSLFMCSSLSRTCKRFHTIDIAEEGEDTDEENEDYQNSTATTALFDRSDDPQKARKDAVAEVQRRFIQDEWQSYGWRSFELFVWPPNVCGVSKALKCLGC
jgi:hypothetical protein